MSNEITFDQIKVGDRIKVREVYKNGDTFEGDITVTGVVRDFIYSEHRVFDRLYSDRESLTFERVQMQEPKKIGTVVEYMYGGNLETAVLYTLRDDIKCPWTRSDAYNLTWGEILASDPNPKIKED